MNKSTLLPAILPESGGCNLGSFSLKKKLGDRTVRKAMVFSPIFCFCQGEYIQNKSTRGGFHQCKISTGTCPIMDGLHTTGILYKRNEKIKIKL